jgi:hypothetical protein
LPSSTEQKEETPSNAKQLDDYLKEFGLTPDDLNEIKERKAKEKEEAEKPLNEQKRWAKIVSTGIAEGKISKDDVLKYEELANKSDDDIVFENFKQTLKVKLPKQILKNNHNHILKNLKVNSLKKAESFISIKIIN